MRLVDALYKHRQKFLDSREAKFYSDVDASKRAFKSFARKFYFDYDASYAHYFSALGIMPTNDKTAIRDAYRAIIKKYHPDVNKGFRSEEITREANEAYRFLSNYNMHSEGETLQKETKSALMDALSSEYERLLERDYEVLRKSLGGGSVEKWYYDQEVGKFLDWNRRSSQAVDNVIGDFMGLGKEMHALISTGKKLLKHESDDSKAEMLKNSVIEAEYLYDRHAHIERLVETNVLKDFYASAKRNSEEAKKRLKA